MGKVIKGNLGGGQEKADENNPADSVADKSADVVEISPGNQNKKPSGTVDGGKDNQSDIDLLQETLAAVGKELPELGRLNKMLEAAKYISSLAGTNFSMLRAGSSYKDNVIVFQKMYSEGAKDELYRILEESSEEMWKAKPGYYFALIEVLRRKD